MKISDAENAGTVVASDKLPIARADSTTPLAATMTEISAYVLTRANLAALDLSGLPTSNPGGGRLWLSAGVLRVGA